MIRVYLYSIGQKVIIPKIAQTDDGMLIETRPIRVFSVTSVNKWKACLLDYFNQELDIIQARDQTDNPGSYILDRLDLERWSDFEKYSVMYTIHRGGKFISVYSTGKKEDGMWSQPKSHRTFHPIHPAL